MGSVPNGGREQHARSCVHYFPVRGVRGMGTYVATAAVSLEYSDEYQSFRFHESRSDR